jgi:hypothetical protein
MTVGKRFVNKRSKMNQEKPGKLQDFTELSEKFAAGWFPSNAEDITLRWDAEKHSCDYLSGDFSFDMTSGKEVPAQVKKVPARVLRTSCSSQRMGAASVRFSNGNKTIDHLHVPPIQDFDCRVLKPVDRTNCKFAISPDAVGDAVNFLLGLYGRPTAKCDLAIAEIKKATFGKLQVDRNPSGLIVIAGGTGTGKSVYAKAILLRWLMRVSQDRFRELLTKSGDELKVLESERQKIVQELGIENTKPPEVGCGELKEVELKIETCTQRHLSGYVPPNLVTFEDPIEGWRFHDNCSGKTIDFCENFDSDIKFGIRVTARSKDLDFVLKDGNAIRQAYSDALRQKPAVFYIGESRHPEDWRTALELSASGHLVVTTCHASTLVDTFSKLGGIDGRDALGRRLLASSILGVLHLRQSEIDISGLGRQNTSQTFFSLWRRREESISNFVVDGLSSIVCDGDNVLGRRTMVGKVRELQCSPENTYDLETETADNQKFYVRLFDALSICADKLDRDGQ